MADSDDEHVDHRTLKVVIIGDGSSGKVGQYANQFRTILSHK